LSNIIRQAKNAPTVFVGERQLNFDRERLAETKLSDLFPIVSVTTDADGAKFIPIEEVFNLEKLHRDACLKSFEAGHKKGYDAGLKEGLKKAEDVMNKFDSAINDTVNQRQQMIEESKQKLLELVIQISKKVTFDAIEINPEATLKMISSVVDSLLDRSRIKILVNPDHLTIVEQNINTYLKGSTAIKELAIVPDARVRYGGCFIETPNGDIDARLESQFEILADALLANEAES